MKRIIGLILSSMLLITMFVGCTKETKTEDVEIIFTKTLQKFSDYGQNNVVSLSNEEINNYKLDFLEINKEAKGMTSNDEELNDKICLSVMISDLMAKYLDGVYVTLDRYNIPEDIDNMYYLAYLLEQYYKASKNVGSNWRDNYEILDVAKQLNYKIIEKN